MPGSSIAQAVPKPPAREAVPAANGMPTGAEGDSNTVQSASDPPMAAAATHASIAVNSQDDDKQRKRGSVRSKPRRARESLNRLLKALKAAQEGSEDITNSNGSYVKAWKLYLKKHGLPESTANTGLDDAAILNIARMENFAIPPLHMLIEAGGDLEAVAKHFWAVPNDGSPQKAADKAAVRSQGLSGRPRKSVARTLTMPQPDADTPPSGATDQPSTVTSPSDVASAFQATVMSKADARRMQAAAITLKFNEMTRACKSLTSTLANSSSDEVRSICNDASLQRSYERLCLALQHMTTKFEYNEHPADGKHRKMTEWHTTYVNLKFMTKGVGFVDTDGEASDSNDEDESAEVMGSSSNTVIPGAALLHVDDSDESDDF